MSPSPAPSPRGATSPSMAFSLEGRGGPAMTGSTLGGSTPTGTSGGSTSGTVSAGASSTAPNGGVSTYGRLRSGLPLPEHAHDSPSTGGEIDYLRTQWGTDHTTPDSDPHPEYAEDGELAAVAADR